MTKTLKFRHDLPFFLEVRLQNKLGFYLQKKVFKEYFLFAKNPEPATASSTSFTLPGGRTTGDEPLSKERRQELEQQCDTIVSFFPDPYKSINPVRTRLHNKAQTLKFNERKFVYDYIDENFPVSGVI